MSFGANMDPMDSYNAGYAARLQSALQGQTPPPSGFTDGGQLPPGPDLGPDNYRNNGFPQQPAPMPSAMAQMSAQPPAATPQPTDAQAPAAPPPVNPQPQDPTGASPPQSALAPTAAPAPGQPAPQGQAAPPPPAQGQGAPPAQGAPAAGGSALAPSQGQPGADGTNPKTGQQALSFRDAWQQQTKAQREKQISNFEAQLKKGDETIDSAYTQMMQKLGTRPQTDLTKSDKGMLLMEFGMNMMRNSASPQQGGYGRNFGAAAGAAGAESFQTARQMQAQKLATAQRWDQMQQQLGIAQGREKTNFAERSLLEQGRDDRAMGTQDTRIATNQNTQDNSNQRNTDRITGQNQRTEEQLKSRSDQFFAAEAGRNSRAAAAQSGATDRNNATIAGRSALATGGGARGGAMKTAYDMYVQVHGKDTSGNPLPDDQLNQVYADALKFAANPSKSGMSQGQILDLATKDANRQYAPGALQTMGLTEPEVEAQKQAYIQKAVTHYQQILNGGDGGSALAPNRPPRAAAAPGGSALAPTGPTAPRGTPPANAAPTGPPAARPDGKVAPAQALQKLQSDPAMAQAFYERYGYIPPQYQKYLSQHTSALQ